MWLLGGSASLDDQQDVWYSTDGAYWNEATNTAQWSPRGEHIAVVFNGRMVIIGGVNDAKSSEDKGAYTRAEIRRRRHQEISYSKASNADIWTEGIGIEVMMSFDDGPHSATPDGGSNRTQKVLDTLSGYTREGKSAPLKASFFVQSHALDGEGNPYRGNSVNGQEMLRRIHNAGHCIGIHTSSDTDHEFHHKRATLDDNVTETAPYDINGDDIPDGRNALASDLLRGKAFLETLDTGDPGNPIRVKWVRPPGGNTWWKSIPEPEPNIVKETYGYYSVPQVEPALYLGPKKDDGIYEDGHNWHVDSGDSALDATYSGILENLGKRIPKKLIGHTKMIILFHDINNINHQGTPPNTQLKDFVDRIWDTVTANGRIPHFVPLPDPPFPESLP